MILILPVALLFARATFNSHSQFELCGLIKQSFNFHISLIPHLPSPLSFSLSVSIANTLYGDEAGGFDEATQLFNRIFNTFLFNITEQWFQLIVDDKFLATFDWFMSKKQNHHEISSNEVNGKCVWVFVYVCTFFSYYKPQINGCKYTQFYYGNALRTVLLFCVVVVFSPFSFYLNLLLLL